MRFIIKFRLLAEKIRRFGSWLFTWRGDAYRPICLGFLVGVAACLLYGLVCIQPPVLCNEWGVMVGIIAGIATIISLVLVYETLNYTRVASEAKLLFEHDEKYSSEKMLYSLRVLYHFQEMHQRYFSWSRTPYYNPQGAMPFMQDASLHWSMRVDEARRFVKAYFLNALLLFEERKLSYHAFRHIIRRSGFTALIEIVEPMEWYLNSGYDAQKFYRLMVLADDIYVEVKIKNIKLSCTSIDRVDEAPLPYEEEPTPGEEGSICPGSQDCPFLQRNRRRRW